MNHSRQPHDATYRALAYRDAEIIRLTVEKDRLAKEVDEFRNEIKNLWDSKQILIDERNTLYQAHHDFNEVARERFEWAQQHLRGDWKLTLRRPFIQATKAADQAMIALRWSGEDA